MVKKKNMKISNEDLNSLFDSLSFGLFRSDMDDNFIFINPVGARILGFDSSEDALKKNVKLKEFFIDSKKKDAFFNKLHDKGAMEFMQLSFKTKDGRAILLNGSISVLKDDKDNIIGYEGLFRDHTDHIELRKRLEMNAKVQEVLMDISSKAILARDYNAFYNDSLKEICNMVNASVAFMVELDEERKISFYHVFDSTSNNHLESISNAAPYDLSFIYGQLTAGDVVYSENVSKLPKTVKDAFGLKQGQILMVPMMVDKEFMGFVGIYNVSKLCQWNGKIIDIMKTFSNIISQVLVKQHLIKKLEESEQKYRNIVENSNDGIVILQDNQIKYVNDRIVKMTGVDKVDILGKLFLEFIPEVDRRILLQKGEIVQSGEKRFEKHESHLIKKDGSLLPVELHGTQIFFEGRSAIQSFIRDISAIKKLEKEKRRIRSMIGKADDKLRLTNKEKLVFFSLSRYPLYTDKQISDTIDIPISTVSSIRNRLKKEGYYKEIIIPNFASLGFSSLNLLLKSGISKIEDGSDDPNTVFRMESDNSSVKYLLSSGEGDVQKLYDSEIQNGGTNEFEKKSIIHFPFKSSRFRKFFNFSDILQRIMYLDDGETVKEDELHLSNPVKRFTKREKIVLYALCKYPAANDTEIAAKIKIPRSTVSVIRNRLTKEGVIQRAIVPIFSQVGCELITCVKYKLIRPIDKLNDHTKYLTYSFMMMENKEELITMSLYKNFSIFKTSVQGVINLFYDNNLINTEPEIQIMPLQSINMWHIDFSALVKKKFDLDIDI